MKLKYVMVAKGNGIEYNIGCADWETVFDHYDGYSIMEEFHTVYIMDNYTGEIYAHRDIIEDECGIETREWKKKM